MKALKLTPYPAYKTSGVEWLGDVPAHWQQLPGRACYYEKKTSNTGMQQTTVLSLSYGQIVVKPVEEHHGLVPASFETYQVIEPGDIIIRPTDLQNDWTSLRFGLSRHHGAITSAYMCFHTRGIISRDYGHLLLHTYDLKKIFYGLGSGLRQNLNWRDFQYLPCLVPPRPEQNAIVRYLNNATERIRSYINAKERLINLLEEQRQAVIHRAVTRGLDPNVRLKPSGVKWLGEVPTHWEVRPLKYWVGINEAVLAETTNPDFEFRYLEIGAVGTGALIEEPNKIRFATAPSRARRIVKNGNTIVSTVRTYLKAVWFADEITGDLICSTGFAVLTPREGIAPKFLCYLAQSNSFTDRVTSESVGIAYPAIAEGRLSSFQLCIPPYPEQIAIVEYLNKVTTRIQEVINHTRREIELLKEYRTRLITDVVTGKLDVFEATIKLPKVSDESRLPDKVDDARQAKTTDERTY